MLVRRTAKSAFATEHVAEPVLADAFPRLCGVSLVQGLLDDGMALVRVE